MRLALLFAVFAAAAGCRPPPGPLPPPTPERQAFGRWPDQPPAAALASPESRGATPRAAGPETGRPEPEPAAPDETGRRRQEEERRAAAERAAALLATQLLPLGRPAAADWQPARDWLFARQATAVTPLLRALGWRRAADLPEELRHGLSTEEREGQDWYTRVRLRSALLLLDLAEAQATPDLLAAAGEGGDPHVEVRAAALAALAPGGESSPAAAVLAAMRADSPLLPEWNGGTIRAVRRAGAAALPGVVRMADLGLLIDGLFDPDLEIARACLRALRLATGQDFGHDDAAWRRWARENRETFRTPADRAAGPPAGISD